MHDESPRMEDIRQTRAVNLAEQLRRTAVDQHGADFEQLMAGAGALVALVGVQAPLEARQSIAADLRRMADWLEQHPGVTVGHDAPKLNS